MYLIVTGILSTPAGCSPRESENREFRGKQYLEDVSRETRGDNSWRRRTSITAMETRSRRFELGGKYASAWYRDDCFPSAEGSHCSQANITRLAQEAGRRLLIPLTKLLSKNSRDIICSLRHGDDSSRNKHGNDQAYGYSNEELLALSIQDLRAPETQRKPDGKSSGRAAAAGVLLKLFTSAEWECLSLSRWFTGGQPSGRAFPNRTLSIDDITEHERAERSVGEVRHMSGIFNSAMDAIISTGSADQRILNNPAAETMFRCERSRRLIRPLERFVPGLPKASPTC